MMDKIVSKANSPRQLPSPEFTQGPFKANSQIRSVYGSGSIPPSQKTSATTDTLGSKEPVKYKQIGDVSGLCPITTYPRNAVSKLTHGNLMVLNDRSRYAVRGCADKLCLEDQRAADLQDSLKYRREFARNTLEKNGIDTRKISDRFLLTSTGRAYCGKF
jgi:hypothetical protein